MNANNNFVILGLDVSQDLTEQLVRAAFRKRAKIIHPNKSTSDLSPNAEAFNKLTNARDAVLKAIEFMPNTQQQTHTTTASSTTHTQPTSTQTTSTLPSTTRKRGRPKQNNNHTQQESPEESIVDACIATALYKLRIFRTQHAAIHALDKELDENFRSKVPRNDLQGGVKGQTWHIKVVQQVVIQQKHKFIKLNLKQIDLQQTLKHGKFLIDGILNDSFVSIDNGTLQRWYTDPQDKSDPRINEDKWRHMIAVQDGRILEKEFTIPTEYLWITHANMVDQRKAYMLKILMVYDVGDTPTTS